MHRRPETQPVHHCTTLCLLCPPADGKERRAVERGRRKKKKNYNNIADIRRGFFFPSICIGTICHCAPFARSTFCTFFLRFLSLRAALSAFLMSPPSSMSVLAPYHRVFNTHWGWGVGVVGHLLPEPPRHLHSSPAETIGRPG